MRRMFRALLTSALIAVLIGEFAHHARAQTAIQFTTPSAPVVLVPLSATAAVNTQTTLTLPTPVGGWSNYVCYLAYQVSTDATGGALTNVVSTSTNFNAFAVKFSQPTGVNLDSGVLPVINSMGAVGGCPKSTIPGTATTFVSPSGATHSAWTWYAVYYQAP